MDAVVRDKLGRFLKPKRKQSAQGYQRKTNFLERGSASLRLLPCFAWELSFVW
jgi:hypothetical protein